MVDIDVRLRHGRFRVDKIAHIEVNYETCKGCLDRACLTACPACCYVPDEEKGIAFNYQNCLECGTCYIICGKGALRWEYPRGGYGINYRFV